MNNVKFIVARLIVDLVFLYYVTKTIWGWLNSSYSFSIMTPTIFVIFFGALAVYNYRWQGLTRSLGDVTLGLVLFLLYQNAAKYSYDILQSNLWFIVLVRGIVGYCFGLLIFSFFKYVVSSYIKVAQIYSISQRINGESVGFTGSFLQPLAKAKFTIAVPVVNYFLHKGFSELFSFVNESQSGSEGVQTEESQVGAETTQTENSQAEAETAQPEELQAGAEGAELSTEELQPEEQTASQPVSGSLQAVGDVIQGSHLFKIAKNLLKVYVDYLDECVLAYCYAHPDNKFFDSCIKSIQISVTHATDIISKIAVVVAINYVTKILLYAGYVYCLFTVIPFTYVNFIISFLFVKCLHFVIQDVFCEPLLMRSILETFCSYDTEDNGLSLDEIREKAPSFFNLERFN